MIVVQRLVTHWTKASRGAPAASARNATPEALALPAALLSAEAACLHHAVDFREGRAFQPEERAGTDGHVSPMAPWLGKPCSVRFDLAPGRLDVSFRRDSDLGDGSGRPPDGPCFVLAPGQWGRVAFNGVFGDHDTGEWYYEKEVFNVAHVDAATADLFLAAPTFACLHMARLR